MTNGETAFLVTQILLFIVGPLILFVRYALKFSDETYEPRYQPRTYRTSAREYFLSTDLIFPIFLLAFGVYLLVYLFRASTTESIDPIWAFFTVLGSLIAIAFGAASYFLSIGFNYWKHTRDRVLAFDPEARTLTVQTEQDEYIIGEGDIIRVDVFTNENHRNLQEYYLFKLRDGRELIITHRTKGAYAIFDFFQNLPQERHKRWHPTIQ